MSDWYGPSDKALEIEAVVGRAGARGVGISMIAYGPFKMTHWYHHNTHCDGCEWNNCDLWEVQGWRFCPHCFIAWVDVNPHMKIVTLEYLRSGL